MELTELTRDVAAGDKYFYTNLLAGEPLVGVGSEMSFIVDPGPNQEIITGRVVEVLPNTREIKWRIMETY